MKNEEKELLIKFLCKMLPYWVKVKVETNDGNGNEIKDDGVLNSVFIDEYGMVYICIDGAEYELNDVKPYLRTMSSMTKEEKAIYSNYKIVVRGLGIVFEYNLDFVTEWLLKHHFDYLGLIEKGLAIEAPEGMYDMTMEELDEILKDELPKELLTDEQFKEVSVMDCPHAVKYIQSTTNIGLKMSKCYYDMYVTKNQQR